TNYKDKTTDYIGAFIYENDEIALIQHEEGRIVPALPGPDPGSRNWEYQYHLKDHLGNTRVTFTTNPKTIDFTLNYESNIADPDDEALFYKVDNIIANNFLDYNHLDEQTGDHVKVQLLNGSENGSVGSVLTIPVGAGDKISAEVYALYLAPTSTNNPAAAIGNLVLGAITGSTGINNYEGAINSGYGTNGTVTNLINANASSTEPMAFINLLFLPDDGTNTIESSHFAFKQITSASGNSHSILALDEPYEAPEAGYVVVYLSNESAQLTEVYFDDLKVTVEEHPVIQTDDYYPFGLQHDGGYQRTTSKENQYKYNGKELIKDLGIDWYDYGARMYMSDIGRWNGIDPLAQLYIGNSPYTYVLNQPTQAVDPNGMACAGCNNKDDWKPSYVGEEKPDKPDYFPRLDYEQNISESIKSSSEEHDYELDENGNTVKVKDTDDDFDRLLDEDGNVIGQVNKGFLKEGQNLMDNFNLIVVGNADDQKSYASFILKLSQFEGFSDGRGAREILGFLTQSINGIGDILLTPFRGNTRTSSTWSVGQFQIKGDFNNSTGTYILNDKTYKLLTWIHTHPGRAGATSMGYSSPSGLDRNITKTFFKMPGIIYGRYGTSRISSDGKDQ
ncbi:MAG: RHS repeat-associated core domain-containing protein, partial [Bacteroidota bacterium]